MKLYEPSAGLDKVPAPEQQPGDWFAPAVAQRACESLLMIQSLSAAIAGIPKFTFTGHASDQKLVQDSGLPAMLQLVLAGF